MLVELPLFTERLIATPGALPSRSTRRLLRTQAPLVGLALTALALARPPAGWSKTFEDNFGTKTKGLGTALARSIGSALPVISASPGIVYRFNIEMGVPQRETEIGGQLFLERPETVGRHRWNLSLNYQRVKIETLNGEDIGQLRDPIPIVQRGRRPTLTIPLFGIDLDTHEFTASATLGVTDDLDLNITVPVLYSDFGLVTKFRTNNEKPMTPAGFPVRSNALGVGDVFVRGKYRFLDADWARLALGAVLRVPSGNEQNFQGTGAVELAPMLYASSRPIHVGPLVHLETYLNAGFDLNADDVDRSEPRWGVGLDCGITERLTVAVAVLGRHPLRPIERPGFFDVARRDTATGRTFFAPLFGIRDRRPDFYDLSIGGRVNLWRDTLIGFVNAIVPLNADGFRAEAIPLAGVEATF